MKKITACMSKIFMMLRKKSSTKRVISSVLCICVLILSLCAMYYDFSVVSVDDISEHRVPMPDEVQAQNMESLTGDSFGGENKNNDEADPDDNTGADAGTDRDKDETIENPENTDKESLTIETETTETGNAENNSSDHENSENGETESAPLENGDVGAGDNGSVESGSETIEDGNTEIGEPKDEVTGTENIEQDTEKEETKNPEILNPGNTDGEEISNPEISNPGNIDGEEVSNPESTDMGSGNPGGIDEEEISNPESTDPESGNLKEDEENLLEANDTELFNPEDTEVVDESLIIEDTEEVENALSKVFLRNCIKNMNPAKVFDIEMSEERLKKDAVVSCGTIGQDTIWTSGVLYDGTLTVEKGVTLTITGQVEIDGNVTINGGGRILRDSTNSGLVCIKISGSGNLKLSDITLDGGSKRYSTSMILVYGKIVLDNGSVIKNCVKSGFSGGPAIIIDNGAAEFYNTTIENCSTDERGGAIYLDRKSNVVIYGGTYKNNSTTGKLSEGRGGGFVYNANGSVLTIYGGNFMDNRSSQRGGCIYHAGGPDVTTYVYGGVFKGNTAAWPGYEGSGAIWNSSVENNPTTLVLAGDAQYCGNGVQGSGADGIYLDQQKNTPRKIWISDTLSYPVSIYVKPVEGYVIAEGKDYTLLHERDMKKLNFVDIGDGSKKWYAVLNRETNQVIISEKNPDYGLFVTYVKNGAKGKTVVDDTEYKSGDFPVVLSADGLSKDDSRFIGWNTKPDGSGKFYQEGDTFEITEDTSLYAVFEETDKLSVSFYSGENCNKKTEIITKDEQTNKGIIQTLVPDDIEGWDVVGWNQKKDEYLGNIPAASDMEVTADTELYASYEKNVTITYQKQNSEEMIKRDNGVCYANVHEEISYKPAEFTVESEWTEKNIRFIEWNTKNDGTGESYQPGDEILITEDTTLYAIMEEEITFTASFYSGEMCTKKTEIVTVDSISQEAEVIMQIPEEIDGWTAVGWSREKTLYQPEFGIQDTASLKEDTEFYAVYQKDISVSYMILDGEEDFPLEQKQAYANVHNEIGLVYPKFQIATQIERKGYHFLGWNTKEDGTGVFYEAGSTQEFTSDTILFAQWIDDIAPVFQDISYNEGHKNLLDWIIRKKSLLITVPIVEEGSGIKSLNYTFLSEQGEQTSGTLLYEDEITDKNEQLNSAESFLTISSSDQNDVIGSVIFREIDNNIAAEISVNTDFKGKIILICIDQAGNVSLQNTITSNGGIIVENRAPKISFSSKDGDISEIFEHDMVLDVTVEDDIDKSGISGGISMITYQVDDGTPEEIHFDQDIITSYSFEIPVTGDGQHKILVAATDHAENRTARVIKITIGGMYVYYVEHYGQEPEGDGYKLLERITETGHVGENVSADIKQYIGFNYNSTNNLNHLSGVISGDDSLVLKIYYDRILYGVNFDLNGAEGNAPVAQTARYGCMIKEVEDPVRRGYIFKGWYTDAVGLNENYWDFTKTVEQNTDQKFVTLYAKWADETAPVLMDTRIESGYENFFDWIIKKESLTLTVPVIEEGSGVDVAEYTLLSETGDTVNGTAELISDSDIQLKESSGSVKSVDSQTQSMSAYAVVVIEADFKGNIYLTCTDKAGNISAEKCLVTEDGGIIVEDNAPEIIMTSENGSLGKPFYEDIVLDIEVQDDINEDGITSEIKSVSYSIDGTDYQIPDREFSDGMVDTYYFCVDITGKGDHQFSVTAVDHAGNQNTEQISITILKKEKKAKENIETASTVTYMSDKTQKAITVNMKEEPQTGDSTQTGMYVVIFMIAGFTYLFLYFHIDAEASDFNPEERKNRMIGQLFHWAENGNKLRKIIAFVIIFFVLIYYHLAKKCGFCQKGIYEK